MFSYGCLFFRKSLQVHIIAMSRGAVDGYILTEVTLHLHLLYDVYHVYNHPGQQKTITLWQRLHYTYPLYDVCHVYNHPGQ